MINHARTLLLNVSGANTFNPEAGEEIIPAAFRAKALPQYITNIRTILFGRTPDRAMLNYRCRQLLGLLHQTELEEYLLALDSRITYSFDDDPFFDTTIFRPTYVQFGGVATELFIAGTTEVPDVTGHMKQQWDVEVTAAGANITVQVARLRPVSKQTVTAAVVSGLSIPVPLHGSRLTAALRNTVGLKYRVTSYARPELGPGTLAASLASLGAQTLNSLFLTNTAVANTEPFSTFRNLWEQHPELSYRLGGLLLALIYRTEDL